MIQASQINEHAEIIGADNIHVGTVDGMEGADRIKLTKDDPNSEGQHHFIPLSWVESIDGGKLKLSKTSQQARDEWENEVRIGSVPTEVHQQ